MFKNQLLAVFLSLAACGSSAKPMTLAPAPVADAPTSPTPSTSETSQAESKSLPTVSAPTPPPPSETSGQGDVQNVQLNPAEYSKLPEVVTITGDYAYTEPVRAVKVIVKDATITCAEGKPFLLDAREIEWVGTNRFLCAGKNGDAGANGLDWTNRGWCKNMRESNAENDYNNGGNEAGGNGTNGTGAKNGSSVLIRAAKHDFASNGTVEFSTRGGRGGDPGRGGRGRDKCKAPSGDDCAHGTKLYDCRHAPDGVDGSVGADGRDGTVIMTGDVHSGTPRVSVNAAPAKIGAP